VVQYRRPLPLERGRTIGIATISAPEPATEPDFFRRGVAAINDAGYCTVLPEHTLGKTGYTAASGHDLADDLHLLFGDPEVAAVICAGGGINANRILRHLDFALIGSHHKPMIGVSNPTVLLNAITARTGLMTFHGPSVVWDFGAEGGIQPDTARHLWTALTSTERRITVAPDDAWAWLRPGHVLGRLVGGNLTSLQSLLGTPYEPDWTGAVLFWEDIAKPVDRLDMMLTHFRDAGVLDKISGMIVGQLVSCDPSENVTYDAMLLDLLDGYTFPILTEVPLGHTPQKITVPIGGTVSIQPGGDLTFDLAAGAPA
jgi:muramoyltetrapeptide carboxypeptidase